MRTSLLATALLAATSAACSSSAPRYGSANPAAGQTDPASTAAPKRVALPFPPGTEFRAAKGSFGAYSQWDLEVPYNTPVLAMESGQVIETRMPYIGEGACDSKREMDAHVIRIRHEDGTVASYAHVNVFVKMRQKVRKGHRIATTANNGNICRPNLNITLYKDDGRAIPNADTQLVTPLFERLPEPELREGSTYRVP